MLTDAWLVVSRILNAAAAMLLVFAIIPAQGTCFMRLVRTDSTPSVPPVDSAC